MLDRRSQLSADLNRVVAWRIDRLRDAGFPGRRAAALARDPRCDVHALLDLVDRGCSVELAGRILAPLGGACTVPATSRSRLAHHTADACSARIDRRAGGSSRITTAAAGDAQGSQMWIERLTATGAERDAALVELHVLLSRAARFEVNRRRAASRQPRRGDDDDLAHDAADRARVAILRSLSAFRGESSFRTCAYKFALHEAAANVRKRAWRGREIPLKAQKWPLPADDQLRTAEQSVKTTDTLAALGEAIEAELTPHQREVLVAIALNGVPIDVLAEWLNTTRGALYETLHAGRQQLRAGLDARGLGHRLTTGVGAGVTAPSSNQDRLIAQLTGPLAPELGCDECFEALDRHVELELAGADADATIPGMRAHLEGCPACAEEHRSLRALLLSEASSSEA